ncbi:prolyl oligopeptidase family serine peptidase [Clostridium neuense]|uniref:Prolyl oligopeptidase family serine peptidase n=1 Tax=Clostridium neuense TaxID=1728934 RepID=A0ABW8TKV0_9CLOT
MEYKKIITIKSNPSLEGMALMVPDVVYSNAHGVELKMQIFRPWSDDTAKEKPKYPLIVFVQGSAWKFPDVYYEIPQLAQFAREGYVVATLTHRNSVEGHPFPAFLQDIKTGIRFLRKHASDYLIDPERVGIWGTSSGGNTALLVGLTGNEDRYKTEEYAEYSDSVKMVVDCFGPADFTSVLKNLEYMDDESKKIFESLRGEDTKENIERLMDINPVNHIEEGKEYPPFLILHGNKDTDVEFSQSELMFHKLSDAGYDATLVCVDGAPHEGSFWSREVLDVINKFILKNL